MIQPRSLGATLEDLCRQPGKAELIGGRIVPLRVTGRKPNRIAGRIYRSLDDYAALTGKGEVFTDNIGFAVPVLPSGRESFSPDASFHFGPFGNDPMGLIQSAPTFAVEVRSACDYGPAAETEMAAKRADYFAAGTLAVWDVDPLAETIRVYRRSDPGHAVVYVRGQDAEAEPAVPGWTVKTDWIFG